MLTGFVSSSLGVATDERENSTSSCYVINSTEYCFYTADISSESDWNAANEFCAARNSTLPIIADENIHGVFRQFLANDSDNIIRSDHVWLAARANRIDESVRWRWIDGRSSGLTGSQLDVGGVA